MNVYTTIHQIALEREKKKKKKKKLEQDFSNFSGSKITNSKSVARCVAIIIIFCNK